MSRNVVLVPPRERLCPWSQNSEDPVQVSPPPPNPGKLTFHFDQEASSSVHAEHYSTPFALEAAAWERRVGLLICCSSQ